MNTIDAHETLGQLVEQRPARARIFDALGIDYCCKGNRTLDEASRDAGRSVEEVAALLRAVDAASIADPNASVGDGVRSNPVDLLDEIVHTHHAFLRNVMPELLELGRKVRGVHGDHHRELHGVVADAEQLWAELEPHLDEEERDVFPAVRAALLSGDAKGVDLAALRAEHESAGDLLERLREVTSAYAPPSDACMSYQRFYAVLAEVDADTRRHIHKENNVVFPAVDQRLGADAK